MLPYPPLLISPEDLHAPPTIFLSDDILLELEFSYGDKHLGRGPTET